jgi:AAA+ ATPase superfamily predicted ATPase
MRGRRRVGKSRLAETFVERAQVPTLYFTASRQGADELELFAEEALASRFRGAELFAGIVPDTWDAALRLLHQVLPADEPTVIVIDEFPYLIEKDPSIEATLQKQWDRLLSRKPVLLILVGSDLAMMEALNTHGRAFFQRGTEMVVPPMSPKETAEIVGIGSAADAFDAYLLTGGLPWAPIARRSPKRSRLPVRSSGSRTNPSTLATSMSSPRPPFWFSEPTPRRH